MTLKTLIAATLIFAASFATAADHPIVFLATPKVPGAFHTSDTENPYWIPGADLMLLNADGTEETLVARGSIPNGVAITDPSVSLDGKSVYYAHVFGSPKFCDIYRIDLTTRVTTRITDAKNEWQPLRSVLPIYTATAGQVGNLNTQAWAPEGVFNMCPCETPDGLVFVSNRHSLQAMKEDWTNLQLYRCDRDGKNPERIGTMNLGGALHPSLRADGMIEFSSGETQGYPGGGGNSWSIWEIAPDGSNWGPVISLLPTKDRPDPFHFQTRTSDGSLVATRYYSPRTNGTFYRVPPFVSSPFGPPTIFGSSIDTKNPAVGQGSGYRAKPPLSKYVYFRLPWQPRGMSNLTEWATHQDGDCWVLGETVRAGAVQHPAAIPGNGIIFSWTGRFPSSANSGGFDYGIYSWPEVSIQCKTPDGFTKVVDVPNRHEWMPRAVVPWASIHGSSPPSRTYDKAEALPIASPYGIVGSSGVNYRETIVASGSDRKGDGLHPVDDIEYIRFVLTKPNLAMQNGKFRQTRKIWPASGDAKTNQDFSSRANERMAVLGDIPLKKYRQTDGSIILGPEGNTEDSELILRADGQPDTSFQVIVPADQPWTFALLDKDHKSLSFADTWHQTKSREKRNNCGGCHAHHRPDPIPFSETFAATEEYVTAKLKTALPVVEFATDGKPILDAHGLFQSWNDLQINNRVYMYGSTGSPLVKDLATAGASPEELKVVSTWIDTGLLARTTVDQTPATMSGPWADTNPPTLVVHVDADGIVIGAADPDTGVNLESLSVKASWAVNDRPAGTELADLFSYNAGDETWTLAGCGVVAGELTVEIRDQQGSTGNVARLVKTIR